MVAFLGRFISNLFGNLKAWLQALLVGAGLEGVAAVRAFVASYDPSDPDPIVGGLKALILSFLLKAFGLVVAVKAAGAAVRAAGD